MKSSETLLMHLLSYITKVSTLVITYLLLHSSQVKSAVSLIVYFHLIGIAHRDLKPENILCETDSNVADVRICDFDLGNAIVLQQESPVTTPELQTPVSRLSLIFLS